MKLDLTGKRFGRLTAVHPIKCGRYYKWHCVCDCGNTKEPKAGHLMAERTSSCGCLSKELTAARNKVHGETGSPEYRSWLKMKGRCLDPNNNEYRRYGARGIAICPAWLGRDGFMHFLRDMGRKPTPKHTLDRRESTGNYEPENCRWATQIEQQNNKRNNHRLSLCGEIHTISEWERKFGFRRGLIQGRIGRGWSPERAITTPV